MNYYDDELLLQHMEKHGLGKRMDNQTYKQPDWAECQIYRMSGLVEDKCEHGVGHPNAEWMEKHDPDGSEMFGIHGCDGCCNPMVSHATQ